MDSESVIIGAGPAGLTAAAFAPGGALVLEARRDPGWKILLSGGGRANVTNTLSRDDFLARLGPAARFLKSAICGFGPEETRAFLARFGCPTVEREERRVYPKSNRSGDPLDALLQAVERNGSQVYAGARVAEIFRADGGFLLEVKSDKVRCRRLLVAAGSPAAGREHPEFDTTLRALGHTIVPWVPGLAAVPLEANPFAGLDGLTFRARLSVGGAWLEPGDVLVTADGISGPAPLDASAAVNRRIAEGAGCDFLLDFLPGESREQTLHTLLALRESHPRAGVERALERSLPRRLALLVIQAAGLAAARAAGDDPASSPSSASAAPRRPSRGHARRGKAPRSVTPPARFSDAASGIIASQLRRADAERVARLAHEFPLAAAGIPPLSRGCVASGGIPLSEVNPRTMESRIVPGLFFAGEILHYDAPSGGFNITCAMATGRLAASAWARD